MNSARACGSSQLVFESVLRLSLGLGSSSGMGIVLLLKSVLVIIRRVALHSILVIRILLNNSQTRSDTSSPGRSGAMNVSVSHGSVGSRRSVGTSRVLGQGSILSSIGRDLGESIAAGRLVLVVSALEKAGDSRRHGVEVHGVGGIRVRVLSSGNVQRNLLDTLGNELEELGSSVTPQRNIGKVGPVGDVDCD